MSTPSLDRVKNLRVVELREELSNRGLQTSGLKKDLISRLLKALAQESDEHGVNKFNSTTKDESLQPEKILGQYPLMEDPMGQTSPQIRPLSPMLTFGQLDNHAISPFEMELQRGNDNKEEKQFTQKKSGSGKVPMKKSTSSKMNIINTSSSTDVHVVFEENEPNSLPLDQIEVDSIDTQSERVESEQMVQAEDLIKEDNSEVLMNGPEKENEQMAMFTKSSDTAEPRNPLATLFEVNVKLGSGLHMQFLKIDYQYISEKSLSITRLLPPFDVLDLQALLEQFGKIDNLYLNFAKSQCFVQVFSFPDNRFSIQRKTQQNVHYPCCKVKDGPKNMVNCYS